MGDVSAREGGQGGGVKRRLIGRGGCRVAELFSAALVGVVVMLLLLLSAGLLLQLQLLLLLCAFTCICCVVSHFIVCIVSVSPSLLQCSCFLDQ